MSGQTVYASFKFLDEVFMKKNESTDHNLLYQIMKDYSHVMVDLTEEEFETKIQDNPFLKSLIKREAYKCFPLKNFFGNIEEEDLSSFPRDIFLLDNSDEFCEEASKKFGVMILNTNTIERIEYLAKRRHRVYAENEFVEAENEKGKLTGWPAFIADCTIEPINSAIVIDGYILSNESGIENLTSLLTAILPVNIQKPFHVLIITNHHPKFSKKKLLEFKKRIQKNLRKVSGCKLHVKMGIITHTKDPIFHDRFIITNYNLLKSGYGFDLFKNGYTKKETTIEAIGVYYTLANATGDPEIKIVFNKLKKIKEYLKKIQYSTNNAQIRAGFCNNRLLIDF